MPHGFVHARMSCNVLCLLVGLATPVLAAAPKAGPIDLKNPPHGLFYDEWYAVTLSDAQCGYMHSTMTREADEIISVADMNFTLQRDKVKLNIGMKQTYRETLDGRPLAFEQVMNMAGQPITQRGKVNGRKIKLTTQQFGTKQVRTLDFDPEVRFAWGQLLEQTKHGLAPGTRFTTKTYEPSLASDQALVTTTEVVGPENVQLLNRQVPGVRVHSTIQTATPIESDGWVDQDGLPLVMELNMGAMIVRVVRADRKSAMRVDQLPELFLSTFVKVDRPVDRDAETLKLRLSLPGEPLPDLPNTAMQTFRRIDEHHGELTIKRFDWKRIRKAGDPPPAEYLARSTYIDTEDPLIIELAKKGRENAAGPVEIAEKLCRFVAEYIHKKDLGVGFATASEVAKRREGDCTEHGVLLAALARASKLPSRTVAGLLLVPGRKDEFGYHMWTQVWLNGEWGDLDAAMDQTECDATHIALATLSLSEDNALSQVVTLTSILGKLKIEVLDAGH